MAPPAQRTTVVRPFRALRFDAGFDEDLGAGMPRGYPTGETKNSSSAFWA